MDSCAQSAADLCWLREEIPIKDIKILCVLFQPPALDCVDDKDLIGEVGKVGEGGEGFCVAVMAIHLLCCLSPNKALWVRSTEDRLQE